MIAINKTIMSDRPATQRERFFIGIKEEIAEVAQARIPELLREGNYDLALRIIKEAKQDYKKICKACEENPEDIPIEYTRLPMEVQDALNDGGYETLGDLKRAWPCKVLLCPKIGTDRHGLIFDVLRGSGLLK